MLFKSGAAMIAAVSILFVFTKTSATQAADVSVLYTFCEHSSCRDGFAPFGDFVRDAAGNFYVVTNRGKDSDSQGTIDKLSFNGKKWKAQALHTFTGFSSSAPVSSLIIDVNGNLYGQTGDVIFELTHHANHTHWKYKTLYTFCPQGDCTNGDSPSGALSYLGQAAGLPYDGVSPLYGTALGGGTGGLGVVFQLVPQGKHWTQSIVYDFCIDGTCSDGRSPNSGVLVAPSGTLYGVTSMGGNQDNFCSSGCGVLYQIVPSAGAGHGRGHPSGWTQTPLYHFCHATSCPDGLLPDGRLIMDAAGNIFGTTAYGGTNGDGTIFKVVPNGANSEETVLHNFFFTKGSNPSSGVVMTASGDLLGVAGGGANNQGMIYRLSGSTFTDEHDFCLDETCADGAQPTGKLLPDSSGNFFGATHSGANQGIVGTIFEMKP